jgi:hypothetical protein
MHFCKFRRLIRHNEPEEGICLKQSGEDFGIFLHLFYHSEYKCHAEEHISPLFLLTFVLDEEEEEEGRHKQRDRLLKLDAGNHKVGILPLKGGGEGPLIK